jgi:transposase
MRSRRLSLEDIAAARLAYEVDGLTYREIGAQFGVGMSTIRTLLIAVRCNSRPESFQRRQPQPEPAPPPSPVVEIAPDVRGRLCIPVRTYAEKWCRRSGSNACGRGRHRSRH